MYGLKMMKDDYDDFNHRSDFTVHMVMMDHNPKIRIIINWKRKRVKQGKIYFPLTFRCLCYWLFFSIFFSTYQFNDAHDHFIFMRDGHCKILKTKNIIIFSWEFSLSLSHTSFIHIQYGCPLYKLLNVCIQLLLESTSVCLYSTKQQHIDHQTIIDSDSTSSLLLMMMMTTTNKKKKKWWLFLFTSSTMTTAVVAHALKRKQQKQKSSIGSMLISLFHTHP